MSTVRVVLAKLLPVHIRSRHGQKDSLKILVSATTSAGKHASFGASFDVESGNLHTGVGKLEVDVASANETITISMQVVNFDGDAAKASQALNAAADKLEKDYGPHGGDIWTQILTGLFKYTLGQLIGLAAPDCNGPVAVDVFTFTASELGSIRFVRRAYPGTESAAGCGCNSLYDVELAIACSPSFVQPALPVPPHVVRPIPDIIPVHGESLTRFDITDLGTHFYFWVEATGVFKGRTFQRSQGSAWLTSDEDPKNVIEAQDLTIGIEFLEPELRSLNTSFTRSGRSRVIECTVDTPPGDDLRPFQVWACSNDTLLLESVPGSPDRIWRSEVQRASASIEYPIGFRLSRLHSPRGVVKKGAAKDRRS